MIAKIFGANWKTSISGIGAAIFSLLSILAALPYETGGIANLFPVEWKPTILKISIAAALLLKIWNSMVQKDKNVVGGTVQQTTSGAVADPGTQTLVDQTVIATINSGEPVTAQQRQAVKLKTKSFIVVLALTFCLSLTGCETVKKIYAAGTVTVSEQTSDNLIVSAEKATLIGKDTFDTFLRLEYKHRAAYAKVSPKIHEFSVWLREPVIVNGISEPRGISILKTARVATKTFKANRTPENEANLRTAYATLQKVIADCQKYTALAASTE